MRKMASPHPKPQPLPLFLKSWRKHRDLTQQQLAERLGMSDATISRIEKGAQNWDQAFLQAAADVLRCEPVDLLIRDPMEPDSLWSIYGQLTPPERRQAVEVIKTLKRTGSE